MIALGEGGVRESVADGVTGTFFAPCEPDALADAVRGFDPLAIDPLDCRAAAERFGAERFRDQLKRIVADAVRDERPQRPGARASIGVSPGSRAAATGAPGPPGCTSPPKSWPSP